MTNSDVLISFIRKYELYINSSINNLPGLLHMLIQFLFSQNPSFFLEEDNKRKNIVSSIYSLPLTQEMLEDSIKEGLNNLAEQ